MKVEKVNDIALLSCSNYETVLRYINHFYVYNKYI